MKRNASDKIEAKIDEVTKKVDTLQKTVDELFVKLDLDVSSQTVSNEVDRRFDATHYIQGLLWGLALGILGNIIVSFLMKITESVEMTLLGWTALLFLSAVMATLLILWFLRAMNWIWKTNARF